MKKLFALFNQRPHLLLLLAGVMLLSNGCIKECVGNLAAFKAFREIGGFGCDCSKYVGYVQQVGALNTVQVGEKVLFCATNAASGVSFDWDFGDGVGGTTEEVCHPYADPDCYTADLSADDGTSSCTASKSVCVEELGALKTGPTTTTISGGSINNINGGVQTPGAAIPIPVNDADADYASNTLYLGGSIYRCKLDGSDLELLVDEEGMVDLYFEPQSKELFWIQATSNGFNFKASDRNGKNIQLLFTLPSSDPEPRELVVDRKRGKIYWLAVDGNAPLLFETGISVPDPVLLYSLNPPAVFSGLTLVHDASELFFCLGASGNWDVMRFDLNDGAAAVWIRSASSGAISAMRVNTAEEKIYWTAPSQGDNYTLYRANRDGSGVVENLGIPIDNPRVMTVGVVQ